MADRHGQAFPLSSEFGRDVANLLAGSLIAAEASAILTPSHPGPRRRYGGVAMRKERE
jgi:hypothetical protein